MGRHIIFDTWQHRWLELATMPTGDPRVIATSWTRDKGKAFAFPSLQAARNMADALGGEQFKVQKL